MTFFEKKPLFVAVIMVCAVALQAHSRLEGHAHALDSVPFCVKITNPDNQPVEQMNTQISISGGNILASNTNLLGQSCFTVPDQTEVTVTLVPEPVIKKGVNVYDTYLISKHILGMAPLTDEFAKIAADANTSNSVTTFDIVSIHKVILGQLNIFANVPNPPVWLFFDASTLSGQAPPNINQVSNTVFAIAPPVDDIELVGVKLGDVNHSAVVNSTMQEEPIVGATCLLFDDQVLAAGQETTIHFTFDQFVRAAQGGLEFEQLEILSASDTFAVSLQQFGVFEINADKTILTFARQLAGTPVSLDFDLRVRAKTALSLYNSVSLNDAITPLMAFADNGDRYDFCLNDVSGTSNPVAALQPVVAPNPWNEQLRISFHQPLSNPVTVDIYDALGRHLAQLPVAAGSSNITLTADDVHGGTGLLFYKISGGNWSGTVFRVKSE